MTRPTHFSIFQGLRSLIPALFAVLLVETGCAQPQDAPQRETAQKPQGQTTEIRPQAMNPAAQPQTTPVATPVPPAPQKPKPMNPAALTRPAKSETGYNPAAAAAESAAKNAAAKAAARADATPTFIPGQEPIIVFDKTQSDHGTLAEGEKAQFSFHFTNAGKSDLEIQEVQKSCGCTKAEATNKKVKPGEGADIEGEVDTTGRSGKQMKTVTVKSNDPKTPSVTLRVEMNIRKEIDLQPSSVNFGVIDLGKEGRQEVKLTNTGEKPLRVTGIDSNNEKIKAVVVSPSVPDKPGESGPVVGEANPVTIAVSVDASSEMGNVNGQITIHTDNPSKPTLPLYVGGKFSGDIEVYPANVFFGLMRNSQPSNRTARLYSRSGTPFKIEKVETEGMPMTITHKPLEGKEGYELQILVNGELQPDQNRGKIHIVTTHPKQKTVDIGVTAYVRQTQPTPPPPPRGQSQPSQITPLPQGQLQPSQITPLPPQP